MLTPVQQQALRAPRSLGVHSVAFQHGKSIPREFTARGDDINPPLAWTGIPNSANAIAIVMDDLDALPGTSTRWAVWNLPSRLEGLEAGAKVIPMGGVEGRSSAGRTGYAGPDPASGTRRYAFRVFALDRSLDLPPGTPAGELWARLQGRVLAWGEIVGTFTKA